MLVTAMKWPSIVDPAISTIIIQEVFKAPDRDEVYCLSDRSRFTDTKNRTAKVPTAPASEGVKNPCIMPPTTTRKIAITHATGGRDTIRAFQSYRSDLGATAG